MADLLEDFFLCRLCQCGRTAMVCCTLMDEDITNQVRKAEPVAASDGKEQKDKTTVQPCTAKDMTRFNTAVCCAVLKKAKRRPSTTLARYRRKKKSVLRCLQGQKADCNQTFFQAINFWHALLLPNCDVMWLFLTVIRSNWEFPLAVRINELFTAVSLPFTPNKNKHALIIRAALKKKKN